jgi:steroid delta-isomerase-like uncharacterized protein
MSIVENKALARRSFEAFNQRDLAAADAIYAPSYVLHNPIAPPDLPRGPDGVRQQHAGYLAAFPDAQITVEDLIAEGDRVAVRVTVRGTHRGIFMGVAPTGRPVALEAITIYRVDAGKIVEDWTIADIPGLQQQLGASAPAAPAMG